MSKPSGSIVRRLIADKAHLADTLSDPTWLGVWHELNTALIREPITRSSSQAMVGKWQRSLAAAEDFAVSSDLCAVLTQAAVDLPDDYIPEHHHLFAEHGLVWLETPLVDEVFKESGIRMMTWHHGTGYSERKPGGAGSVPGLEVNLGGKNPQGHLLPIGSDFLPYGMESQGWSTIVDVDYKLSLATRFVLAMQSFMRQELPAREAFPYPRSYRGFARRMGWPERHVTVIDLRKRKYVPRETGGQSGRTLHVRHLVRGTWAAYWVSRSHPFHSGLSDEKERVHIYRHPHLRGSEDLPLAMTDRIHVVRR